jgi:chromosome segregation ATPase
MQRIMRSVAVLVVLVVVLGLSLIDAGAQTRRKRRSRRAPRPVVTNPTITSPDESASGETKVISTADETSADPVETTKPKKKKTANSDEDMQDTINALSNQVNRLNDKLTQMQSNDRSLLDMERLTRAEQRSESLRSQQLEAETKLADLQSQMDQIDYALKPENIERVTSGYGTTRPEEARDTRRRQLESEKARLQAQIRILETSRTRLETAVANADAEVDALRRRLQQNDATPSVVESQPARSPKPER